MLLSAARYSFANAKVRALRSGRLSGEDFYFLLQAQDLEGLLAYLATTSYQPINPELPLRTMQRTLFVPLFTQYHKIVASLSHAPGRRIILALFGRFEAENLKMLLRAMATGLDHGAIAPLLYPLGALSTLDWNRLHDCTSPGELIQALDGTLFARPLAHAMAQHEAGGALPPLEAALDLAVFRHLASAVDALAGRGDRRAARRVLGGYVDILNCLWVIRLRLHFGLSPEEIVNYSLPGGRELSLRDLHMLAKADTVARFIARLPASLAARLGSLQEWSEFRPALQSLLLRLLRRTLASFPFHVGVEAAYLLEKEMEIRAVVTIMEAKMQHLPPEATAQRLPAPLLEEAAHV